MNLYDDPFVRKMLDGTDGPDPNLTQDQSGLNMQTQQFVPNSVFPEHQQRVADDPALMDTPANTTIPDPTIQPATAQPPKIQSILDLIRETKPVQDPTLDERYKKAAMLDSLGQAFGNLAGAVGVGMGATVPKLAPNNNIARLYGMRDAEKQRYLQQKRDWDRQMLQGKIQEMGMDAQARKDKETADRWNEDYALKAEKNKQDYEIALGKATTAAEQQKITNDFKKIGLELEAERNRIALIRANKPSASETANDPNKIIYTWRNPYTQKLEQYNSADFANLFDSAKLNKSTDDIKTIMSNYQNNTKDGQKEIVTRMLNERAKSEKELSDRASYMVGSADMDKKPQAYPTPTGKPLTAEQLGNHTQPDPAPPVPGTITGPAVGSHATTKKDWSKYKRN